MCGISGILARGEISDLGRIVTAMTDTMVPRGPDDSGIWCDAEQGIALGQRRLAIVDLSPAGHQPMTSSCGRITITYNGEIYNAAELRKQLQDLGRTFRGHSDTEVIVEGCAVWGVRKTVERLIGMFAFAMWDARNRCLSLVRDRLGIKPLYWSWHKETMLFGSELKALAACPFFDRTIDRNAVVSFLRHNYIPAPKSIYKVARKLEPGWILHLPREGEPKFEQYWDLACAVEQGRQQMLDCYDIEAIDELERLLGDSISRRMISDVPLGAFLSGGIDSSTVVALMQKQSASPVKTFSIGFDAAGYNEAHHAAKVAHHLGTDHTELYLDPSDARDVIPKLSTIFDEPFSDSSQIPTLLVSQLARSKVTVALSGDGGDELFAGYDRYACGEIFANRVGRVPVPIRNALASTMRMISPGVWDKAFHAIAPLRRVERAGSKIHRFAGMISKDTEAFYQALVSHWEDPTTLVSGGQEVRHPVWSQARQFVPDFLDRMQYIDTLTYLPDDILTKVDRASMSVSLEARVPLLDHRLVEFSWRLPKSLKNRDGKSKWILRQVLHRHVPQSLFDRPKMGFGVPIDQWLRGPLKEWASDKLSSQALNKYGLVDPEPVQKKWSEHVSGQRNWQYLLWDVIMLQEWCEAWA